jgi:hypothetical protein
LTGACFFTALLFHFGAPARSIGQHELAVLDHGNMRHQLVLPWHVVDLDLQMRKFGTAAQKCALTMLARWPS